MAKLTTAELNRIIQIGSMLSSERDLYKLLDTILKETRKISSCDAGTLYLVKNSTLQFSIMHNDTMNSYSGVDGNLPTLPPVPLFLPDGAQNFNNVSAYVANMGEKVDIPDVYSSKNFNFEGTKAYDKITGYRTRSMLVIPLKNNYDEIIGVLQLINSLDSNGKVVPFGKLNQEVIVSLSSQAAVAVSNTKYLEEINELFTSFVMTMAKSIDERSPYTANHTKKIAQYAALFLKYIRKEQKLPIDGKTANEVIMAAWLHDIGKLATDLTVMDKRTRLGVQLEPVLQRLYLISTQKELLLLKGMLNRETYEQEMTDLQELKHLIEEGNAVSFLESPIIERIADLSQNTYLNDEGNVTSWLTEQERIYLSIQKGTLTAAERKIMESHVVSTANILSEIKFIREYKDVARYATTHHEFLDGSGYPLGLKGDELTIPTRILTILDIFEALTAMDRPYKKGFPPEKAIGILEAMVTEGKLDGTIVALLKESKIWEN